MAIEGKTQTQKLKKLTWTTFALCLGCCATSVLAVLLGITAISSLGIYFERAALGFFIATLCLLLYMKVRRSHQACDVDCSCQKKPISSMEN